MKYIKARWEETTEDKRTAVDRQREGERERQRERERERKGRES